MGMRLLVLGAGGMLGRAVARAAARLGHDAVALGHADLDITDADHVARVVAAAEPGAVVNCAAFTDVDGAETAEARAQQVNGEGAGNVARAAAAAGARVVHVSTDYVFDGAKREPWLESDPVAPLQAYGRTKLAGERAVAEAADDHAIVRAAWLFGAGGKNFVATMLRLGAERDEVEVVTDQRGGPTWTGHLAPALVEVAERRGDVGVFHATGTGDCSWYELAVEIMDRAGLRCRVVPATSERMARPARRPAYSVLGTERAPGVVLPPWREGLTAYLAEREPEPEGAGAPAAA
jgi:dTDP-4-dehydrorhamnose reductase